MNAAIGAIHHWEAARQEAKSGFYIGVGLGLVLQWTAPQNEPRPLDSANLILFPLCTGIIFSVYAAAGRILFGPDYAHLRD